MKANPWNKVRVVVAFFCFSVPTSFCSFASSSIDTIQFWCAPSSPFSFSVASHELNYIFPRCLSRSDALGAYNSAFFWYTGHSQFERTLATKEKRDSRTRPIILLHNPLLSFFFFPIELWRLQSNVESSINLFSFDWQVVIGGSIVDLVAAVQEDSIQVSAFLNYFLSKRMARDQTRAHTHAEFWFFYLVTSVDAKLNKSFPEKKRIIQIPYIHIQ